MPVLLMGRADMCQTGNYRERGIQGLDGYQTEFVVDKEQYVVRVPAELESVGVLMEPLSIVEKAIDEALRLQIVRCPEAAITPDWIVWTPLPRGRFGTCGFAGFDGPATSRRRRLRLGCGRFHERSPEVAEWHWRTLRGRPQCAGATSREEDWLRWT